MKLTIEASTTELQKMLQAIAGSPEHKNRAVVDLNGRLVSNPKGQTQLSKKEGVQDGGFASC